MTRLTEVSSGIDWHESDASAPSVFFFLRPLAQKPLRTALTMWTARGPRIAGVALIRSRHGGMDPIMAKPRGEA